jgi:hypothetical protein
MILQRPSWFISRLLLWVFAVGALAACEQPPPTPPIKPATTEPTGASDPTNTIEPTNPPETSPTTVETPMTTQELISLIRAEYDDRAIAMASGAGPGVFTSVEPLLADPAPMIRAISLRVLHAADPAKAQPLVINALNDSSDDVKIAAVAILRPAPPTGIMGHLLGAYSTANEPAVRGQIALLAGRVTPTDGIDAWRIHWASESDPYTKADIGKALARMGDEPARQDYVASMKKAQGRPVFDAVRGCTYFEDTWIVPHLATMLSRRDVALHLAADFEDTHPFRTCDVALEAILAITGEPVQFQTPRPTQYSDGEIQIVSGIAAKHSP